MQAVYEEDLIHRKAGQGVPHQFEKNFATAADWIQQESGLDEAQTDKPGSFTRIVIGDLKPEILQIISKTTGREQLCKWAETLPYMHYRIFPDMFASNKIRLQIALLATISISFFC